MKNLTDAILEFGKVPEQLVRGTLFGLTSRIIKRSPVDTGRFRNNWQASTGTPETTQKTGAIRSEEQVVAEARAAVNKLEMGQDFYLSNNLPYAYRLEYGWSKQAPSGMLRVSIAELQQRMNEAAK